MGNVLNRGKVGGGGGGEDADRGIWMALADGAQRWEGHDGVAYPVCGTNHDLQTLHTRALLAERRSRMKPKNASCWGSSISITAMKTGNSTNEMPERFCASFSVVTNAFAPLARAACSC